METTEKYEVRHSADLSVAPDGEIHILLYVIKKPGQKLRFYAEDETVVEGWCRDHLFRVPGGEPAIIRDFPVAGLVWPGDMPLCPECRERFLEEVAITTSQAAARKGCVPGTVKFAHARGDLPGFVLYNVLHFLPEDVDRWELRRPRRSKPSTTPA